MDVGSLGVSFLERVAVTADGSSPSAGGCDRVKSLAVTITAIRVVGYTTVAGDRQTQIAGNETVTVTVQHSDDDAIWVDADAHEFDNDDEVTITLTSPKAYVRVSWALAGDNPQPILTATAVAAGKSQDQIGSAPGGSQPFKPVDTGATVTIAENFEDVAKVEYDGDDDSLILHTKLNMDGERIKNLSDPGADQDAATKKYVDDTGGSQTLAQTLALGNDADGLQIKNAAAGTDPDDLVIVSQLPAVGDPGHLAISGDDDDPIPAGADQFLLWNTHQDGDAGLLTITTPNKPVITQAGIWAICATVQGHAMTPGATVKASLFMNVDYGGFQELIENSATSGPADADGNAFASVTLVYFTTVAAQSFIQLSARNNEAADAKFINLHFATLQKIR